VNNHENNGDNDNNDDSNKNNDSNNKNDNNDNNTNEDDNDTDASTEKEITSTVKSIIGNHKTKKETKSPIQAKKESENVPKTAFVAGFPVGTSRNTIRQFFKYCGSVKDVRVISNTSLAKTTFVCFVEFKTSKALKEAVKLNGTTYEGKYLEIKQAATHSNSKATPNKKDSKSQTYSLFVKNLAYKTTEEKLRKVFEQCGEISSIRIPTHKDTGKKTGFAFIEFTTEEGLKNSLHKNMSRTTLDGRRLLFTTANKVKI